MQKQHLFTLMILLAVLLTGCPGLVDHLAWKELSGGYIYHEPAGLPVIEKQHSNKEIPGWIFAYEFNNEFIVALEKDLQLSEEEREKLIVSGDFYDFVLQNGDSKYWIISHDNDSIYGSFNYEEYVQKRQQLGVPKELELEK